jgi:hypothetical protein
MSLASFADTFNTSLGILVAVLAPPRSQGDRLTREKIESGLAAADQELALTRRRCQELEALIACGTAFLATMEANTQSVRHPDDQRMTR